MPETSVSKGKNGQYKTTIPKGLAEAYDLEDAKLEWKADGVGQLRVIKRDE